MRKNMFSLRMDIDHMRKGRQAAKEVNSVVKLFSFRNQIVIFRYYDG